MFGEELPRVRYANFVVWSRFQSQKIHPPFYRAERKKNYSEFSTPNPSAFSLFPPPIRLYNLSSVAKYSGFHPK